MWSLSEENVVWICSVQSLGNPSIQVADVVRHGRIRWFEHVEHKILDGLKKFRGGRGLRLVA